MLVSKKQLENCVLSHSLTNHIKKLVSETEESKKIVAAKRFPFNFFSLRHKVLVFAV